jgi:hypothetical protein
MTVRFLGTFLEDPSQVPASVVALATEALGLGQEADLQRYAHSRARFEHRRQICERFGYTDFSNPQEQWSLLRWLYARAWYATDKPIALFDKATLRLSERRVLLPGVTVLE